MKHYKVTVTKVTQTANEILGTPEKVLWYLIIEGSESKVVINVGEKTYNSVSEMKPLEENAILVPGGNLDKETQDEIKREIEGVQIQKRK